MARKTRKEKERAQLHHQQISARPGVTFSFVKGEFTTTASSINLPVSKIKSNENTYQSLISGSIRQDLNKTFLLASFIFLIEAMLYWLWK
ncbi:hypothetical protein HY404_01645 [Candidatus Microgenomates bacterium]|nr:hypothetical protein [Candidatus Microgenomates bacterium]